MTTKSDRNEPYEEATGSSEDTSSPLQQLSSAYEESGDDGALLKVMIDDNMYVGDLIRIDFMSAQVLIHDRLKQNVGGLPHGCLLGATRISSMDDESEVDDPEFSVILLRVQGASALPDDREIQQSRAHAGQRSIDSEHQWDDRSITDTWTMHQMRHSGLECKILGTFRIGEPDNDEKRKLEFGGDIDNFYAGRGMKVYKLAGTALETVVNFRTEDEGTENTVGIGAIRYAAATRTKNVPEAVEVKISPQDLIAQRTALFGMTRTGKSNTTKTIATAVFSLRTQGDVRDNRVGQLIFDPNGEYANVNPQDKGCLKNVAHIQSGEFREDVVTYGLHKTENDPDRILTKFNFFGTDPRERRSSKLDWDELLVGLYQGKEIIVNELNASGAGYVKAFSTVNMEAPDDVELPGPETRFRRALFAYRTVLVTAGFKPPKQMRVYTARLFSKAICEIMNEDSNLSPFIAKLPNNGLSWDEAKLFWKQFIIWKSGDAFKNFNSDYSKQHGRGWSDDRLDGILAIYENTLGLRLIPNARQWHDAETSSDYAEDIVQHLQVGKLVICDQSLGAEHMNRDSAALIVRRIFLAQQRSFVHPQKDDDGNILKPPPIIIYAEEAHTLLPKGNDQDTTNIWSRIAKEGAKFNIGLVYATQEPSAMQQNILTNTENWFIGHLNSTDEIRVLTKYNDFGDFADGLIRAKEKGFIKYRTLSSPYTLSVQVNEFVAPKLPQDEN